MSNIQRLLQAGQNQRIFADTITMLRNSQGYYSWLYESVNKLNEDGYNELSESLASQDFKDSVDVVLWLES